MTSPNKEIQMIVTATVFLSDDMSLTMGGANLDAPYTQAFVMGVESTGRPLDDCETVFAVCNSYPEEIFCPDVYAPDVARYREGKNRSLSVGDVVVIDEAAYSVDRFGFGLIPGWVSDHDEVTA